MRETTIKELFEKNPDIRVLIDDEGKVTLKEPGKRWEPEWGQQYWYIDSIGYLKDKCWEDELVSGDRPRYAIGNVFETKSEADAAVERLQIRAELLDCGGKETFEKSSCRWAIGWGDGHLTPDEWYVQVPPFNIWFDSYEQTQAAIEKVGEERIEKYLFGIED